MNYLTWHRESWSDSLNSNRQILYYQSLTNFWVKFWLKYYCLNFFTLRVLKAVLGLNKLKITVITKTRNFVILNPNHMHMLLIIMYSYFIMSLVVQLSCNVVLADTLIWLNSCLLSPFNPALDLVHICPGTLLVSTSTFAYNMIRGKIKQETA